jgi:glycosyltransferase involved in cell wall biosynthesis
MGVFILMPAFNEADKIGHLLPHLPSSVGGHEVRVVVIDDGSTDGTARVARGLGASVIQQPVNQGKGAALCRAMDELGNQDFEALAWMDSDRQHPPSSLPDLVEPVLAGEVDLCVGSRYLASLQPHKAPLNRRLVRAATIRAVRAVTGETVTDPYSGFRCFSKRAAESVNLEGSGYECELESLFSVARVGLRMREVPIPRIYGAATSKMGYKHGALRGRIVVVSGYTRTISRAWRRRKVTPPVPISN